MSIIHGKNVCVCMYVCMYNKNGDFASTGTVFQE